MPISYRIDPARRLVLTHADEVFGMARMSGLRRGMDGDDVGVFRDLAEAEAWLSAGRPQGET